MCQDNWSPSFVDLKDYQSRVELAVNQLQANNVVQRIWDGDCTIWSPDPKDINDRLGWLTLPDMMRQDLSRIELVAAQIIAEEIRHVVLLGMGGSSLGAESLRWFFPEKTTVSIMTLDSTIPSVVRSVLDAVDISATLFIVASKSGNTIEVDWLFEYCFYLVNKTIAREKVGERFIAITDPGSPLHSTANRRGFRNVFHPPSDVGGRFSVLSHFGLVPAALAGVDIKALLDTARSMEEACRHPDQTDKSNAIWLGAILGILANNGRDKTTLVASPSLHGFSMWIEQILAESTGKDGRGIIPVTGEPLMDPSDYGMDRWFVFLKFDGDDCVEIDRFQCELKSTGHPIVEFTLNDRSELGAEFYRWEFATTVAAHIMTVHPFNQPDVQQAKELTDREILRFRQDNIFPDVSPIGSLTALLNEAVHGDYLAILAFMAETKETNQMFDEFRAEVITRYGIATTLGYGPRYLHSTGQLHKAGPESGLFLQVVLNDDFDLKIPMKKYSLKVLVNAQTVGDAKAILAANRRFARLVLEPGQSLLCLTDELGE